MANVSPGPGVNCRNNRMETPLIVAAQNSAIRAITSLTALGTDVDAQDANGNTAMHYAVLNSSDRAIDSLAHAYANFNIPNAVERTAMHLLSISNSQNLARQLRSPVALRLSASRVNCLRAQYSSRAFPKELFWALLPISSTPTHYLQLLDVTTFVETLMSVNFLMTLDATSPSAFSLVQLSRSPPVTNFRDLSRLLTTGSRATG